MGWGVQSEKAELRALKGMFNFAYTRRMCCELQEERAYSWGDHDPNPRFWVLGVGGKIKGIPLKK